MLAVVVSGTKSRQADIIAATAKDSIGKYPYSCSGGNEHGPTNGTKWPLNECNDTLVIGFDCSGLAMYCVYQGTGISIYHKARVQYGNCQHHQK